MKLLTLLVLSLLLTSCVIPNWYGPKFSSPPHEGMSRDELRAHWGVPWSSDWQRIGDSVYETYTYRSRKTVVMPSYGGYSYPEIDWYTVHLKDGRVVGGSW
jgi:hypothetical protein